ncbi:unnamed protein product, partial [Effrenium voratum]
SSGPHHLGILCRRNGLWPSAPAPGSLPALAPALGCGPGRGQGNELLAPSTGGPPRSQIFELAVGRALARRRRPRREGLGLRALPGLQTRPGA